MSGFTDLNNIQKELKLVREVSNFDKRLIDYNRVECTVDPLWQHFKQIYFDSIHTHKPYKLT